MLEMATPQTEEVLASGVVGDEIGDVEIGGDGQQWPRCWR